MKSALPHDTVSGSWSPPASRRLLPFSSAIAQGPPAHVGEAAGERVGPGVEHRALDVERPGDTRHEAGDVQSLAEDEGG